MSLTRQPSQGKPVSGGHSSLKKVIMAGRGITQGRGSEEVDLKTISEKNG